MRIGGNPPTHPEPLLGLEPRTCGLRNRCSTAELQWRRRQAVYCGAPSRASAKNQGGGDFPACARRRQPTRSRTRAQGPLRHGRGATNEKQPEENAMSKQRNQVGRVHSHQAMAAGARDIRRGGFSAVLGILCLTLGLFGCGSTDFTGERGAAIFTASNCGGLLSDVGGCDLKKGVVAGAWSTSPPRA